MTTIDHGFAQDWASGMLDWLMSFRRNIASADTHSGEPRMRAAEPLLLDTPVAPGFRPIQQEDEAAEAPRALSMGAMAAPLKPISLRRDSIYSAFSTAMPVTDRHGLAGRNSELEKLVEAIVVQRKHAVIFGTRGSGKTSLARVFGDLADEAGCVALYGSASGDADFDALFRPFLSELPMSGAGQEKARKLMNETIDGTRLANLLVEDVRQRTILILDEYDRVRSDEAKSDVATLLKLLTDIHSPVQVVLVGIAGDVDGLIAAHPSLRRHIAPQRVAPIPKPELERLLMSCADNARLKLDLVNDHLAGKEMEVGRFYQRRGQWLAATLRFRTVIDKYQTTTHTPEALERLVESYLSLGIPAEAQKAAAVLGRNYPGSKWYERSYKLMREHGGKA